MIVINSRIDKINNHLHGNRNMNKWVISKQPKTNMYNVLMLLLYQPQFDENQTNMCTNYPFRVTSEFL